ncbi:hypothetical protein BpHYR1_020116 [Brachionus plicatilis]|uniref:EGF-like domain-containing protein n=1 Tax=Brachionus plicatilis TaxID=10195 RepID=A0A3M7RY65_BRAPC|nr:hypothetical protein BpHYR1_020116 [Brachionus plicatilis]
MTLSVLIIFLLIITPVTNNEPNSAFTCNDDSDCQNGGKCIQISKDLEYCVCINGFTGEKCINAPQTIFIEGPKNPSKDSIFGTISKRSTKKGRKNPSGFRVLISYIKRFMICHKNLTSKN